MKNALLATAAGTPIEVWFQDEARVGQKGSLTYIWEHANLWGLFRLR
jgi:hypothetical protein